MKKIFTLCVAILATVCLAAPAFAGGVALFPKIDGNDVLVPNRLIQKIPGFSPDKPVYAACDINHWFQQAAADPSVTQMRREGDWWRARGLAGQRFHPVQLDGKGKPIWAKIELVYPLDSKFVDVSGPGPCLLLQ